MGGGGPLSSPFHHSLPLPSPGGLVLKESSPWPSLGSRPPCPEGRSWAGPVMLPTLLLQREESTGWAPQEEGVWARVCKAIFLCSEREGKGIEGKVWGMNTGCGERVRSEGKGPPWKPSVGSLACTDLESLLPAPPLGASTLPLQALLKTPRTGGRGGRTWAQLQNHSLCSEPHSPPPAPSPLLGPGGRKVLGWSDSGGNSIEFSFGYILKAKVSWTYSQNG